MLTKRPASFLLTPLRRVMDGWHRSRGQDRSATALRTSGRDPCDLCRFARARRSAAQTGSENHTLLNGRCKFDRSVTKFDQDNAEICAIQPTTSRTHTRAVSIRPARGGRGGTITKHDQRRLTRSRADPGILRPDLRTAPQTRLGRRVGRSISMVFVRERRLHFSR